MFSLPLRSLRTVTVSLAMAVLLPFQAQAAGLTPPADESFENSAVSDAELDTMRGGAFMINGIRFDFSYFSQIRVQNDIYGVNSLQQSFFSSHSNATDQVAPLVLQNNLPNSVIDALQVVNVAAQGALNNATVAALNERLAYANMLAAKGF